MKVDKKEAKLYSGAFLVFVMLCVLIVWLANSTNNKRIIETNQKIAHYESLTGEEVREAELKKLYKEKKNLEGSKFW
ncbi:MAG: hypothetical protein WC715_00380 [Patescibacteria group bacterium]|jgi:hypothetical protein